MIQHGPGPSVVSLYPGTWRCCSTEAVVIEKEGRDNNRGSARRESKEGAAEEENFGKGLKMRSSEAERLKYTLRGVVNFYIYFTS